MSVVSRHEAPLRVLLFSPVEGLDPLSGDTSYTAALLADPPPGVEYTTYADALADGSVRLRGRKPWHGPRSAVDLAVFAARSAELTVRRSGLMFREYTGYISIDPGAYDLVHQHLPTLRQIGGRLPVVSTAGFPLTELYRERERWSDRHLRAALALDSWLARHIDAHSPWLRPTDDNLLLVYSELFRQWLLDRGLPAEQVRVASTAIPDLGIPTKASDGWTLGVVARDFRRKGGDVAVEAFRLLRENDDRWKLVVATTAASAAAYDLRGPGIEVVIDADRDTVLHEILPRTDILLAPTRSDCGVPFGMLEALQAGTCIVTSTTPWLDHRLGPPAVTRVPVRPDAVAAAVQRLRDSGLPEAQAGARELWRSTFSMPQLHRCLLDAYRTVLGRTAPTAPAPMRQPGSERLRVLVAARPYDLSAAPYDGFVARHRRMVRGLAESHDVTVLSIRTGRPDDDADLAVPGVAAHVDVELGTRTTTRRDRLADAFRQARGLETDADRELAAAASRERPDVVLSVGPWLASEYRPLWRRYPSVHLFEEQLDRMPELAPQSRQAQVLRMIESALGVAAPGQPHTVVSISPLERLAARQLWPAASQCYLPFTLEPGEWPARSSPSSGKWVLAVGNFAENRNADGLAAVLAELERRYGADSPLRLMIVSGPGIDTSLKAFLRLPWVYHAGGEGLVDRYAEAWAALVPATRATGQKTTILQAWACGVPVVATTRAAATVDAPQALVASPDSAGLVDALLELRGNQGERARLARAGATVLAKKFDPAEENRTLQRLLRVAARHRAADVR